MFRFLFSKSPSRRIILSFLTVILIGSFLLALPISQLVTSKAGYMDHLFTTVSLVCVTGLSTVPVAATYNAFGQVICMVLMQIGGLGLMSIIAIFFLRIGKQLTFSDRWTLQESLNRDDTHNFREFMLLIARFTFVAEFIGAVLLSFRFVPMMGWQKGLFTSVFMAISAFCNAGFDNMGSQSLQGFATDPLVLLVISGLIIAGGLGFSVWFDLADKIQNKKPFRRLSLHTKIVLFLTGTILVVGTLLTFLSEYSNPATIGHYSFGNKLLTSFFQSVTMRTAGFATIDYTEANPFSLLVYAVQMFIGGAPGGTAGGIKVTTFWVVVLFVFNEIKGSPHTNFMYHTFSTRLIRRSFAIFIIFTLTFLAGLLTLSITAQNIPFLNLIFETMSALGTVGVSANVTPSLNTISQVVIMILMFVGRIGPITILISLANNKTRKKTIQYAESTILVG